MQKVDALTFILGWMEHCDRNGKPMPKHAESGFVAGLTAGIAAASIDADLATRLMNAILGVVADDELEEVIQRDKNEEISRHLLTSFKRYAA